ncbi:79a1efd6-c151-4b89-8fed-74148aeac7a7 [Thermothielavioides terrestris]|uniref:79a1efd6-c151-4b89-8fed-74148aeac7a7 n=1 Tax=Thermothielavioides terrestris TaxID=2587410 RepID=A0A446BNB6_9PEZI|nr:79a1efd6-c151-4b89-8fed-74148aeac7a7 [Thermothielavioides terrestris]
MGIVRHPNYLGDVLVHLSFPLFLYANGMLPPIALLGPLTNYVPLRCVGGGKESEESQARRCSAADVARKIEFGSCRRDRNTFWLDASRVYDKWAWIVVGCGVASAAVEKLIRKVFQG